MNVTELARQLRTTRAELLEKLPELGFDIGLRAIKIDNRVAESIKRAWGESGRKDRLREQMARSVAAHEKAENKESLSKEIAIPDKISVNDLAQHLGTPVTHFIGYLMKNGIMASLNEQIDFETASVVAEDYGFKATRGDGAVREDSHAVSSKALREIKATRSQDVDGIVRPPVVVVMGHVDHGKTTLLDAIRKTNVVAGESGGITQHIGAYQVEEKGRLITFLDTPGHEAFKAMRERGGQVADVAILVVAADDGLKPQTLESINVIQKENLPFVVAINKMDKPGADIDRVKKELTEINLNPEDWGGKVICTPVSAKKGEGIHELLEMVLLVSDLEKFIADPHKPGQGVIIESHVDSGEGPVATVLVHEGTLRVGEEVVIGSTFGKVKALKDWKGEDVSEAGPSMPVKILGLKSTPSVGEILKVEKIDRSMRKKNVKQYRLVDTGEMHKAKESKTEEKGEEEAEKIPEFLVIVKADALGSLEAFIASLKKLEKPQVKISILKQGLGNITESDVQLAEDENAVVYGFNVRLSQEAQRLSYNRKSEIKLSKIIYELLDDAVVRLKKFVRTEIVEVTQGDFEVLKVFKDSKNESIIGGRVKAAPIAAASKFRVLRDGEPIDEGKIVELQQNKQTMKSLKEGIEGGMKVSGMRGFREGDILKCYLEEERIIS
ncbi:translation initiation factor IF-2 [bacterium CG10_46_32]|nr:MAG: translation initiation factor IF-2 [bacterium CG10_46_32]PIR56180.1 MAG: translation initiation factor IF-2 [Parcubacteria group bacterium CG10_big_fil_rev_8_21_14_0_10_46_32]